MAGISHNAKNSNLPEFGDSVSAGSKALCGLTEAAAQVKAKPFDDTIKLIWDKSSKIMFFYYLVISRNY